MIAKLASGSSQKSSSSSTMTTTAMSASQSKRKRSKLLDLLLNTNWSKQNQQVNNLMKLNKILLSCDANFLDEKTGESPLSLAISSQQINSPLSTCSNHLSSLSATTLGCSPSASLFSLSNQHSSTCHNQLTLRQTSAADLCQHKAPLVERILLLLIKNGAKVDFRSSDSRTPLHVAAMKSNFWALKTLLDLGASTDYRDINGLTPLYYSILHRAELKVTQLLLNYGRSADTSNLSVSSGGTRTLANVMGGSNNDHKNNSNEKSLGITDQQGWQEVHHACKLGLDAHLDKLLYYGCDINSKISGSGNTPLHVAAINDQLNCAKVLLLRGADKTITNNSHQTAHQVAVISNNMDLAEFIAEHDDTKVVPFAERPAPIVAQPIVCGSVTSFINRHSFALPKAYNANNGHHYGRFSISSAQHLVNSQSSNNLSGHQDQTAYSQSSHTQHYPEHNFLSSTLKKTTGIVQPQRRTMDPLILDVSGSHSQGGGSTNSSAPTSTSGASSGSGCVATIAQNSLLVINANQPPQLSNISPSLSQRSCATTNTTATSSSGVCCDGDAHNSSEELLHSQSRHSNITIISIGHNETIKASGSDIKSIDAQDRAINVTSCNKSSQIKETSTTLKSNSTLNSFLPNGDAVRSTMDSAIADSGAVNSTHSLESGHELAINAGFEGNDNDEEDDLRSSGSSNGLYSLMSDERPLFVGSIVEALSDYQSGDPSHLQLQRGNLVEVLEYPTKLIENGQLPRLANKPLLFGRRHLDGLEGLFPSFCVRRTKQRQSGPRQRIALTDITNASALGPLAESATRAEQQSCLVAHDKIAQCNTNLSESQSMMALGREHQNSVGASPQSLIHEAATLFRELQVNLTKMNEGFGFVLRGARINPATLNLANNPTPGKIAVDERLMAANNLASLQYLDDIEPGSVADRAGLKRGDFLVAVNKHDVRLFSHEQVVRMIRQSGDQVSLTIATPVPYSQPNYTSVASKTLNRKKPEPPKRDPTTTLTRCKTQVNTSMPVAPLLPSNQIYEQGGHFDANKPLPRAPNSVFNGIDSPNNTSYSSLNHMVASSSIQSLSSGLTETQSIASVSTVDSTASHIKKSGSREHTPIQSSSSTATLTTVATTKPKAPTKPSHLRAVSSTLNSTATDQSNYQPATVTATRLSQQTSPVSAPNPPSPFTEKGGQIAGKVSIAAAIPPPPPLLPPPPPPMPNFSPKLQSNRLNMRRVSVPNELNAQDERSNRTLKRRESLANDTAPASANISSVAAACAAAANNRLLRQQQKQQQKQQQSGDSPVRPRASTPKKRADDGVQIEPNDNTYIMNEQDELEFPPPPLPTIPPPPPPPPLDSKQISSNSAKQIHQGEIFSRQQMLSATLGKKFSAQIIQQQKHGQSSQSQTLRTKPKRASILDYVDELPPPPLIPPQQKTLAQANTFFHGEISQQIQVNDFGCEHHHHHHTHAHVKKTNAMDRLVDHYGMNERDQQMRAMIQQQQQQQQVCQHQKLQQQQQLLQQQHHRLLLQQQQQRHAQQESQHQYYHNCRCHHASNYTNHHHCNQPEIFYYAENQCRTLHKFKGPVYLQPEAPKKGHV